MQVSGILDRRNWSTELVILLTWLVIRPLKLWKGCQLVTNGQMLTFFHGDNTYMFMWRGILRLIGSSFLTRHRLLNSIDLHVHPDKMTLLLCLFYVGCLYNIYLCMYRPTAWCLYVYAVLFVICMYHSKTSWLYTVNCDSILSGYWMCLFIDIMTGIITARCLTCYYHTKFAQYPHHPVTFQTETYVFHVEYCFMT